MALQQIHDVQPISSYYNSGTCSKQIDFRLAAKSIHVMSYKNSRPKPMSEEEAKERHKISERNRRGRTSSMYAALRKILPNLIKKNKATVLAEAIRYVNELKNTVSGLEAIHNNDGGMACVFPGQADSLSVENCGGLVKVMFSCEDKSRLLSDVTRTVSSMRGKVVRAEMVILGGRTKCVLCLQGINGNGEMRMLRSALTAVTERVDNRKTSNGPQLTTNTEATFSICNSDSSQGT